MDGFPGPPIASLFPHQPILDATPPGSASPTATPATTIRDPYSVINPRNLHNATRSGSTPGPSRQGYMFGESAISGEVFAC